MIYDILSDMSQALPHEVITSPAYVFGEQSPLTPELAARSVDLVQRVAKWNGNTTAANRVVCVTDVPDIVTQYIGPIQLDRLKKNPQAWDSLGSTWSRRTSSDTTQAIWINPDQELTKYVNTFAHELAHAFTRTAHGWTWRRMYIMIADLIHNIVLPDVSPQYTTAQHARGVVHAYRSPRVNGIKVTKMSTRWQVAAYDEAQKHIAAAERCRKKFGANIAP